MIRTIKKLFSRKREVVAEVPPLAAPPSAPSIVQKFNIKINNSGNGTVHFNVENLPSKIVLCPYERITGLFLRTTIENTADQDQPKIKRKIWEIIGHEVFMIQVENVVSLIKKPGQVEQLVPVSGGELRHSAVSASYILGKMFDVDMNEVVDAPEQFFASLINKKIEVVEIPQERFERILAMV